MTLRRAIRLYAGLEALLTGVEARAATERIHRLLQFREWGRSELRLLIERLSR